VGSGRVELDDVLERNDRQAAKLVRLGQVRSVHRERDDVVVAVAVEVQTRYLREVSGAEDDDLAYDAALSERRLLNGTA
jgi:hypothetical protein